MEKIKLFLIMLGFKKPILTLNQLNEKFIYTTDKKKKGIYEHWAVPKIHENGKIYGDCEDYLLALIFYCGINVNIYWATSTFTNEGHVVGEKNGKYIDNNTQEFTELLPVFVIKRRVYYIEMFWRMFLTKSKVFNIIDKFKKDK